jgi:dTDP-4-dehydrorhamnose 3,5-epimerase-like enzyme
MRPILPLGVSIRPVEPHHDRRDWLVEAFRESWAPGVEGAQVNLMWSRAGTLRGSRVHSQPMIKTTVDRQRGSDGVRLGGPR